MTENEAKKLVFHQGGSDGLARMEKFTALVSEENQRQNLVAPSTIANIWVRHVADSVQLIRFAPSQAQTWLDIGTGGGFPGMAVALVSSYQMLLVEPRRRRADFLSACVEQLGVAGRVVVRQEAVQCVRSNFDIISARAVASVRKLLLDARHCGKDSTRWLLPRGGLREDDRAVLKEQRVVFHVEQSLTDESSDVLVIEGVIQ